MRIFILSLATILLAMLTPALSYATCNSSGLGVSRIIEIDTKGGGLYGTVQYKNTLALKPGEVVLTFDDGPHPKNTVSILNTLKTHCTKATFFAVGQMIRVYPGTLKKVSDAGHTIAAHTHSHPNMTKLSLTRAKYEIERSFAEAIQATGKPIAPFFRFPGLAHSKAINNYLGKRNIATLSVDIISNDTRYPNPRIIIRNIMSQLAKKKSGIILMHDLKTATAQALPGLLRELKRKGYKVVHIKPKAKMLKAEYTPLPYEKKKVRTAKKKWKPQKKKQYRKASYQKATYRRKAQHRKVKYRKASYKKPVTTGSAPAKKPKKRLKLCLFLLFGCVD